MLEGQMELNCIGLERYCYSLQVLCVSLLFRGSWPLTQEDEEKKSGRTGFGGHMNAMEWQTSGMSFREAAQLYLKWIKDYIVSGNRVGISREGGYHWLQVRVMKNALSTLRNSRCLLHRFLSERKTGLVISPGLLTFCRESQQWVRYLTQWFMFPNERHSHTAFIF